MQRKKKKSMLQEKTSQLSRLSNTIFPPVRSMFGGVWSGHDGEARCLRAQRKSVKFHFE